MSEEMRVWIGCLACYNDGRLVGQWYDAVEASDVTSETLHEVEANLNDDAGDLLTADLSNHEELWVMDHEGFGGLLTGECSPMEARRIAEVIESVDECQRSAFIAYASCEGGIDVVSVSDFEDAYCGEYDSEREYAESYAEDCGLLSRDDDILHRYIDWDAFARDLFIDSVFSVSNPDSGGGVFVFHHI